MSSVSGVNSSALNSILNYLNGNTASTSTANGATSTSGNNSGITTASNQKASITLLAAETQFSAESSLIAGSDSDTSSMDQLAMSADNYKFLAQTKVLQNHPELINTLLNLDTSSQTSSDGSDSSSIFNSLESSLGQTSGVTDSSSILDLLESSLGQSSTGGADLSNILGSLGSKINLTV